MMVGRELEPLEDNVRPEAGEEMLRVEDFSRKGAFQDITFTVHAGEVLTFFGLVGAGRTEVARALMGLDSGATGHVTLRGKPVHIHQPEPGDESRDGLPVGRSQERRPVPG